VLPFQEQFIEFALKSGVLRFGEFELKSGRTSPYFFNTGLFDSGCSMLQFSRFFALSIANADLKFDVLFGPAYKGITLSCISMIQEAGAEPCAVFLALDRQELGQKDGELMSKSAIQEVENEYGIPVVPIATMSDLIEFLKQQEDQAENLDRMLAYRAEYGIK